MQESSRRYVDELNNGYLGAGWRYKNLKINAFKCFDFGSKKEIYSLGLGLIIPKYGEKNDTDEGLKEF